MMRFLLHAALAVALITAVAARALAEAASAGFGVSLCSVYINEITHKIPRVPSDADASYYSYTQGYMSALNLIAGLNNYTATDLLPNDFLVDAQKAFIFRWCHQNPGRDYETATLALYTLMRERQALPQFLPALRPSTPSERSMRQ
jgi:hypothetical protein